MGPAGARIAGLSDMTRILTDSMFGVRVQPMATRTTVSIGDIELGAKRLVQQRCAEWTDHNVSDPGVTLIETFAFMTDELLYRLNRVPDRLYITFLDLLGVTLHPPTPARVDVTAWLAAPPTEDVVLPEGSEVATLRSTQDDAVVFATTTDLVMPPRRLAHVLTRAAGGDPVGRDDEISLATEFACFSEQPAYDDALLLGLDQEAPSCVIGLRFECHVQGVGVDPTAAPLVWEAWDGTDWVGCEVDRDDTGGLNRPGDVVIHVPRQHTASVIAKVRAGWLRCRVVPAAEGYPFYSASPTITAASAFTLGGTVRARARRDRRRRGDRSVRGGAGSGVPARARSGGLRRPPDGGGGRRRDPAGKPGARSTRSPTTAPTTRCSGSTARPATSGSGRRCGSPTGRCATTARCPRRARHCGCPPIGSAADPSATSPRGRSGSCGRRCPASTGSRTAAPPSVASPPRPWTRRRCAGRSRCAPATVR